jgi:predicted phosphodiesterase
MKIAVLSDIHGNWHGMNRVVEHVEWWQPDVVVIAGDTVNRGPRSADCWALVQSKLRDAGWLGILGNHEEYVIAQAAPNLPREGVEYELRRPSLWTYEQLGCNVAPLQDLPRSLDLPTPAGVIRFTHGTMLGTRDGVYRFTPDEDLPAKIGEPLPAAFCVGHTHQPLVRHCGETLVVNAGAAGMPFDGDWRVSYAQLTRASAGWQGEIVRLEYDRERADRDYVDAGFIEGAGPLARIMQRELQVASGLLYTWFKRYEERVKQGEISLEVAVDDYLRTV